MIVKVRHQAEFSAAQYIKGDPESVRTIERLIGKKAELKPNENLTFYCNGDYFDMTYDSWILKQSNDKFIWIDNSMFNQWYEVVVDDNNDRQDAEDRHTRADFI